jgi:hypothetical protein
MVSNLPVPAARKNKVISSGFIVLFSHPNDILSGGALRDVRSKILLGTPIVCFFNEYAECLKNLFDG